MIFYQQAAIADKKLRPDDLKAARWDTAVGTVLTQCLTGAVLIAAAATLASSGVSANLASLCLSGCFSTTQYVGMGSWLNGLERSVPPRIC